MIGQVVSADGYRRILVVMAMAAEARPIVTALGERWGQRPPATPVEPPMPMRGWRFAGPGGEVLVTINGEDPRHGVDSVGTQPAAIATHAGIRGFAPDLVLTVGTAGALPGTADVGEVFHAAGFRFHDRRIAGIGTDFERYGVYALPALALGSVAAAPAARPAVVSSGNALNPVVEDFRIMREHGAILKEMEGAAVAWVAGLHGLPCGGVKAITNVYTAAEVAGRPRVDTVDEDGEAAQFRRNFDAAVTALARHLPPLLEALQTPPGGS
jgi:uridine phosphorylase